MRRIAALLLLVAVLPVALVRDPPRRLDPEPWLEARLLVDATRSPRAIGPFALRRIWRLSSRNSRFFGLSGLAALPGGLLAISDQGYAMEFPRPERAGRLPLLVRVIGPNLIGSHRDTEAMVREPRNGTLWVAFEGEGGILRLRSDLDRTGMVFAPEMADWPDNRGPEAMTRLSDGRFVVLGERRLGWLDEGRHPGLVYGGDPVEGAAGEAFVFAAPPGYRPTDMATLPDGRVLVLHRRLLWPFPPRFAALLSLADPRAIAPGGVWQMQALARLPSGLPIDNMEAMAVEPLAGGLVKVWLLSDDNGAITQDTLLWELTFDPAKVPAKPAAERPGRR